MLLEKAVSILDKYKAKVTFFIRGEEVKKNGKLISSLNSNGHEIALAIDENKFAALKDYRQIVKDIKTGQTRIKQVVPMLFYTWRMTGDGVTQDIMALQQKNFDFSLKCSKIVKRYELCQMCIFLIAHEMLCC